MSERQPICFNQITHKIDSDGPRFILLEDFEHDGISVKGQFETMEEALFNIGDVPAAIVELTRFRIEVTQ